MGYVPSHRLLRCVTITRLYLVGSIGGHNLRDGLQSTGRIGMSKIHKTWDSDGLPIGIGFDTLVKAGPLPIKIGFEIHYYVEQDDKFGPEWLFRFMFVPVLPSPKWSQKPLF